MPVAFAAPFDSKPIIVKCWLVPPVIDAELLHIAATPIGNTITAAGFTASLAESVTTDGYELQWEARR